MTTEHKIYIVGGILTLAIIVGAVFLSSGSQPSEQPLLGQDVKVESREHVPDGTKIKYNSNPPAAGAHYVKPQDAGVYETPPPDGNLVHSLEHGAVILWYRSDISPNDKYKLIKIYSEISAEKKIMTVRDNMDTPIALTSWGKILKLKTVDEEQITNFFKTNMNRAPENEPI